MNISLISIIVKYLENTYNYSIAENAKISYHVLYGMAQNPNNLSPLRHSLAHLLAAAVTKLWPGTKRAIGPAVENGFYYDFEFKKPISNADLPMIEKKMLEILSTWGEFKREEITLPRARELFGNEPYKKELVEEFHEKGEVLTTYTSGSYTDLCAGGHVENARDINSHGFALTKIAGAYWRGSAENPMLTRIYGLAFENKEDLDAHLKMLAEAEKRDHRKLGKELDLFVFSDLVGAGLPLFTPKGTLIRNLLDEYVWKLRKVRGYEQVDIPHLTKKDLYETSGHWQKFGEELFKVSTREGHEFAMKPMNCPHHTQIYKRKNWSYRQLPQRYASTTKVYRDEQTGELSGLTRVRAITQDDAHVFCRFSQVKEEIEKIWDIVDEFYAKTAGFSLDVRLSLHDPKQPEKYLGGKDVWERAENELRSIVSGKGVHATEVAGEAAFYGPKIDFVAHDSLGREWQVATIQLDMNLPERFDLYCINEKSEEERIVMLHAAIMGSLERFLATLIEHYGGAFPLWLSPVQVAVIPVGEAHEEYAKEIVRKLRSADIRAELKASGETLGKRIRATKLEKTPYFLVLGDKEKDADLVMVESRGDGQLGTEKIDAFIQKLVAKIIEKK